MTKVHLISGFLGTGKTTAILHLLRHKPAQQKWAVLVNEFGEIGIDGAIIKQQGVVVREVPGGCMCCVSGLPFQIGLNMLLAREQPDVLLIEPTGLGHPAKLLASLQEEQYHDVLSLGATLTLLDPRHLLQDRYLQHEIFVDQLQLADVLIANKTDLADSAAQQAFENYVAAAEPAKSAALWTTQGQIPQTALAQPINLTRLAHFPEAHSQTAAEPLRIRLPLAAHEPYRRFQNQGQGYFSLGWLLQPQPLLVAAKFRNWVNSLQVERLKAIVCSDEGNLIFNYRDGVLTEMAAAELSESRVELINDQPFAVQALEQQLLECRQ